MQIVDFNNIAISSLFGQDAPEQIEVGLLRHTILNRLRIYNLKFRDEYGEMVLACDSTSWRKEVFPEYKAPRQTTKDASPLDWGKVYEILTQLMEEIRDNFPYRVISVPGAEGDDIIGHLVDMASDPEDGDAVEPVVIISNDKDFLQLQRHSHVSQFSPSTREMLKEDNPIRFLFNHICRGDSGDGIPNVLSDGDTFVDATKRQKRLTSKKIDLWWENRDQLQDHMEKEVYQNFLRNTKMINLSHTPADIRREIERLHTAEANKQNGKIFGYLIKNRCNMLIECANDFHTPKP